MAELNVNPADLLRVADAYNELAARAALISPQAAVEVQRIAETHGPMGYPAAVGIAAGLAMRAGPLQAKVADFTTYAQRFDEHAATYTTTDQAGAAELDNQNIQPDHLMQAATTVAHRLEGAAKPPTGVQGVDFKKQDPPPPAPPLPPPRPQTGEPINLPSPTTPGPVTVITANVDPNGPDDPQKQRCGPAEIGKDTTIAVGGALGIATGIAGEIPTLGAATAAIVAGAGALWDGMDKLGECK
jgi:Excreted virulence factor EspC, type VII ESX diderm